MITSADKFNMDVRHAVSNYWIIHSIYSAVAVQMYEVESYGCTLFT